MSVFTAVPGYLLMRAVGVDFAGFWALMLLVLNFIPNVGALVATVLPALMALVQFDAAGPALLVAAGLAIVQLAVAGLIEPRFVSRSHDISPLAVIHSLVRWGILWGVPGMLLSIPIMVTLMIDCSQFPRARPEAILLTRDGSI
ncbi:MAG: AI-2E family transporter, partial [Thermoanaerobaculia bacterium]